ncbi:MAG: YncE family protein [Firmicutes bacterium]|nr:YncE family protein [Bacillota bacterium]
MRGLEVKKILVANVGSDSLSIVDLNNDFNMKEIFIHSMLKENENNKKSFNSKDIPRIGVHQLIKGECNILYSVNSYNNTLYKIDIEKEKVINSVHVGSYPTHMVLINNKIYITNSDSNSISVVDEDKFQLIENIAVNEKPHDIVYYKKNREIYIANSNGYSISIFNLDTNKLEHFKLDVHPLHLYLRQDYMYILSSQNNGMKNSCILIFDINNKKILERIYIDDVIMNMTTVNDESIIFTTNISNGFLYKLNFNEKSIINKYYIGGMPNNILWDGKETLYITNTQKNILTVLNYPKGKIIRNIKVGKEPNGLLFL